MKNKLLCSSVHHLGADSHVINAKQGLALGIQ